MWKSQWNFQRVCEGWKAGFLAFHTLSFPWPALEKRVRESKLPIPFLGNSSVSGQKSTCPKGRLRDHVEQAGRCRVNWRFFANQLAAEEFTYTPFCRTSV